MPPEIVEEARRLKDLYEKGHGDYTQGKFGTEFGIGSQGAVWQFLNGHTALNLSAAAGFARGLKCSISDFSPRLAEEQRRLVQGLADLWPFPMLPRERFDALSAEGKAHVRARLLQALEEVEAGTSSRPLSAPARTVAAFIDQYPEEARSDMSNLALRTITSYVKERKLQALPQPAATPSEAHPPSR